MTTRIGTYGATQGYVAELMAIQTRMQTEQSQVSTGLKSTAYSGIAADAADVLNLNSQLTMSQQFVTDNSIASTKLTAASDAISSIQTTIQDFNNQLNSFMSGNTTDPGSIATLQSMAFQSLQSMQNDLGANIGGDYIFSGGRVSTDPVQLPATSLSQFQAIYNGSSTSYPTSRATDLASFNIGAADTGPLTVNADGTITATNAKAFLNVPVGSTITLGGLVPPTPLTVTGITNTATTINGTNYGPLTLSSSNGTSTGNLTITSANLPGTLAQGQTITLAGLGVGASTNNGSFVISSIAGNTLTLAGATPVVPAATSANSSATTIEVAKSQMMPETETAATVSYGGTTLDATGSDGTAATGTGTLSIASVDGGYTITPATVGSLAGLTPGTSFTLGGTTSNNGTYVVASNNGVSVTVSNANYNMATATSGDVTSTLTDGGTSMAASSYGSLSFGSNDQGQITIAASTPDAFVNGTVYPAGTTLTVVGSSPNGANDGQYTVLSNDGTTMAVERKPPVPATSSSGIVPTSTESTATLTDATTGATLGGGGGGYGVLTVATNAAGQVTLSSSIGALGAIAKGDTISLAGANSVGGAASADDGTYQVLSNQGGVLTLANSTTVTPSIANSAATVNGTDYGPLTLSSSNGTTTGNLTVTLGNLPGPAIAQGQTITLAGLGGSVGTYNGSFVVSAVAGNVLTLAAAAPMVPATTTPNINGNSYGNLTFSSSNGNLTVASTTSLAGQVPALAVGSSVTIGGSTPTIGGQASAAGVNDGTFIVTGISADNLSMTLASTSVALTDSAGTQTTGLGYGGIILGSNAAGQMTVTAATAGGFAASYPYPPVAPAVTTIKISGTVPNGTNDGTYVVTGNDGTTLTLATTPTSITAGIQPTTTEAAATLTDKTSGTVLSHGAAGYGTLSVGTNASGQMTISASVAGALSTFTAGDTIAVTNATNATNDGTYYVQQVNGDTLTLASSPPAVTANSWYKGDTLSIKQPTSATGNVGVAVYASDPAFEKAIRAMAMIAQGAPNTPGGLAANQDRIKAASYLLGASLNNPGLGTPPPPLSGSEEVSNITSLSSQIGFNLANINNQNNSETLIQGFIQTRLGNIENEDPTTAITSLEADSNSLQASYQSLAQLFSLSLLNYIK